MKFRLIGPRWAFALVVLAAVSVAAVTASAKPGKQDAKFVLGVSNTHINNGWREEMICAIKAEAKQSGKVSKVILANRETDVAGQVADIRSLISAGANAIIINPASPTALNTVIAQAAAKGIKVISVDQRVTAPQAYDATNDQVAYGRGGAAWLFKTLGGKGNVVEMRGFAGVPADTDRHTGFKQALKIRNGYAKLFSRQTLRMSSLLSSSGGGGPRSRLAIPTVGQRSETDLARLQKYCTTPSVAGEILDTRATLKSGLFNGSLS